MLNKTKKTESIGIRCTEELLKELEKIAEEKERSISYIVNKAIEEYIRSNKND